MVGPNNHIDRAAIIFEGVILGKNNIIGPGVVIYPGVDIGDNNFIDAYSVIGAPPEHRKLMNSDLPEPPKGVIIGNNCRITCHVTIDAGLNQPTRLHDNVLVMSKSHIGHDAEVHSGATVSAGVILAGHVTIHKHANLGINAAVHQFVHVGQWAMVGMGTVVTRHVEPGKLVYAPPARVIGENEVGLSRNQVTDFELTIERERFKQILVNNAIKVLD